MNHILVIDYETSSFPEDDGAPINFAAALLDPTSLKELSTFSRFMLMEEGDTWSANAEKVHGYSQAYVLEHGVTRKAAYASFLLWLRENGIKPYPEVDKESRVHLMGHNIEGFDIGILKSLKGVGKDEFNAWFHYRVIDTMKIAFAVNYAHWFSGLGFPFTKAGEPSVSLESIRRYYRVTSADAHTAVGDVRDTAEIFRKMIITMRGGMLALTKIGQFQEAMGKEGASDAELLDTAKRLFARKK